MLLLLLCLVLGSMLLLMGGASARAGINRIRTVANARLCLHGLGLTWLLNWLRSLRAAGVGHSLLVSGVANCGRRRCDLPVAVGRLLVAIAVAELLRHGG